MKREKKKREEEEDPWTGLESMRRKRGEGERRRRGRDFTEERKEEQE